MTDRSTLPPLDPALLARAAEMLALPERVCRRRDCRRRARCSWVFRTQQQPCCLANLDAGQRQLFDTFAEQMRDARALGGYDSGFAFASPFRETRALQDAAVEAVRPLLAFGRLRHYRIFVARREKRPPPTREGHEPRYD